jgi:hypothetical protein
LRFGLGSNGRGRGLNFNLLLWRALERASANRTIAQRLDSGHDVIGLIVIRFAKCRGPRQTVVHRLQNRRKLGQRLDTWIPGLGIYCIGQLITREIRVLLEPGVIFNDLIRIGRRHQDLGYQQIRIDRDW